MQTPQNLIKPTGTVLTEEYWAKKREKRLIRQEKRFQEILEARKNPPNGKKVFDFSAFANLYERPDEVNGREPIHNIKEETMLRYEWRFYFDDTFEKCKDEESFANRMYEIDEVR